MPEEERLYKSRRFPVYPDCTKSHDISFLLRPPVLLEAVTFQEVGSTMLRIPFIVFGLILFLLLSSPGLCVEKCVLTEGE